jgi:antitoxin HigA-1
LADTVVTRGDQLGAQREVDRCGGEKREMLEFKTMAMHNPPHPGEFITQVYLEPNNLRGRELAGKLGVAASTLNRILTGTSRISPEMALRLSKALGRSPESWLAMEYNHDLWHTKQYVKLGKIGKVQLTAA